MPHLVLIDGSNYVFRAFHAIRGLSNSRGEPTNAIYGYAQMLRSVLKDVDPTHMAVAFDPEDGTFRNRIYPEYKAHRPPMPEDLAVQWPFVFEITRAYNLPLVRLDDYEADDVIATLAKQAEAVGWQVTIVSTDKDLMQLVDHHIHMLDTMKGVRYDVEEVRKRWGVCPHKIRDLLALTGDASDNIPGIPGIGAKTAAQLLQQYGSLEGVLSHAQEIKQPRRRRLLLEYADAARLSRRLVQLEEHAPLDVGIEDLRLRPPDPSRLIHLFKRLEFRRLLAELEEEAPAASGEERFAPERTDLLVDSEERLQRLLAELKGSELFAVDTETTSLACHDADIVGIAFATRPGEAWYIPIGHEAAAESEERPPQLSRSRVLEALRPILEDPRRPKCGHNLKYDIQVFRRAGIEFAGIRHDSLLLAYCLYPGKYPPSLDAVARDYLDYRCIPYHAVTGKGKRRINFAHVPIDKALPYAAEDADIALRLCRLLRQKLADEGRLKRHDEIELPLSFVLADMEWIGAHVDAGILTRLSQRFGERIRELEHRIHAAAGKAFNIHSPRQLGEILFDHLRLPGGKRTRSGQWATGQQVLEALAEKHEVPRLILEARQLAKLKSTYTDALRRLIHPQTGRIHTSYNQAVTSTGRLSSSDPNLQNIPIRSREGREIRKAFTAESGRTLIAADYSQIELRLLAHFSGDEVLRAAFIRGTDIHAATAAAVNQVALDEVTGAMRRRAKIINFGILYGMSAFGLARQLGIDQEKAQAFIDAYFQRHPGVRRFMLATLEEARRQGYVETLLGHRVYIPEINAANDTRRANAERTAINAPLQGSAADIIKVAMIRLHEELQRHAPEAHMILQVHDELVVEAPEAQAQAVAAIMRREMESAVSLHVPLTVDIGTGKSWFDAHRL